jgi:hypothetical protein
LVWSGQVVLTSDGGIVFQTSGLEFLLRILQGVPAILWMHGGKSPKGSRNAFKHGFYSAQSIATRREARSILHAARKVIEDATKGGR